MQTDQWRAEAIGAMEKFAGRTLTVSHIYSLDYLSMTWGDEAMELSGQTTHFWQLLRAAADNAVESGAKARTPPSGLKYVKAIMERCRDDGCLPGYWPQECQPEPTAIKISELKQDGYA